MSKYNMENNKKRQYQSPTPFENTKNIEHLEELMPLIRERLSAGQSVKFSPHGISMLPMLRQGRDNVVLSSVTGRLKKYDLPLYQRKNGQYVLHRVVRVGETYSCIGDNQFVTEHGIEDGQIIAVVTAFTRDNKLCRTKSVLYRIYCVIWHHSRIIRRIWRGVKRRVRRLLKIKK